MAEQLQDGEEKIQAGANEYSQLKPEYAADSEPAAPEAATVSADAAREKIEAQDTGSEDGSKESFGKRYVNSLTDLPRNTESAPTEVRSRDKSGSFLQRYIRSLFR